jgi:hypothetical protein
VAARGVVSETTGKWIFRKSRTSGLDEFWSCWRAAKLRELDYDYSGYVLGNYIHAQQAINHFRVIDDQSDIVRTLGRIFTAAYPFEEAVLLPELAAGDLADFCHYEYADDAADMLEAIRAAHVFYQRGFSQVTDRHMVVFVIE